MDSFVANLVQAAEKLPSSPFSHDVELPEAGFSLEFSPYSIEDRVGRFADWALTSGTGSGRRPRVPFATTAGDEEGFDMVSRGTTVRRSAAQYGRPQPQQTRRVRTFEEQQARAALRGRQPQRRRPRINFRWDTTPKREGTFASLNVMPEWPSVGSVTFHAVEKLVEKVKEVEELAVAGQPRKLRRNAAPVPGKTVPVPLVVTVVPPADAAKNAATGRPTFGAHFSPVIARDPIIAKLVENNEVDVVASAEAAAALMCARRAQYGFDVLVRRDANNVIWLDRRDDLLMWQMQAETASIITFDETRPSLHPARLAKECTSAHDNFKKMAVDEPVPLPAVEEGTQLNDEVFADRCFTYRKFTLESGLRVLVRGTVDAVASGRVRREQKRKHGFQTDVSLDALAEDNQGDAIRDLRYTIHGCVEPAYDGKNAEWQDLYGQKRSGKIYSTELKNNAFRSARWIAEAYLAGADSVALGFMGRRAFSSPDQGHRLFAIEERSVHQLFVDTQLTPESFWGQLVELVNLVPKTPKEYVLVRPGGDRSDSGMTCFEYSAVAEFAPKQVQ